MEPTVNPYESPKHGGEHSLAGNRCIRDAFCFLAGMLFVCAGQLLAGFIVSVMLRANW